MATSSPRAPWRRACPGALALLLLLLSGATAGAARRVRVGAYENLPKIGRGPDGEVRGFWPDLLAAIAAAEGWELEYVWGTWSASLVRLEAGALDVMPDVGLTEGRRERFRFSEIPALLSWSRVLVREGAGGLDSIRDLDGRRVAVLRDSVNVEGPEGLRALARSFGIRYQVLEVDSYPEAFAAVRDGAADAAVANRAFSERNASAFGLAPTAVLFQPITVRFAFPPEPHPAGELRAAIDAHLAAMREDPDSLYYRLLERDFESEVAISEVVPAGVRHLLAGTGLAALVFLLVTVVSRYQVRSRERELEAVAEERLQEERRFREILDAAEEAILVLAPGSREVRAANRAARALVRSDPEDPGARDPPRFHLGQENEERLEAALRELPEGGTRLLECPLPGDRGEERWVELSMRWSEIGAAPGILVTARDTTHRRRAEGLRRRLERSARVESLGNLAAGIAHDFNNLLGVVMGYTELAQASLGEPEVCRPYLDDVLVAARRGQGLARQILTFSRQEEGEAVALDVAAQVREGVQMLRQTVPAGVELRVDLPERASAVVLDPTRMMQVLLNLGTNAFQAMEGKGGALRLTVDERVLDEEAARLRARASGRYVRLTVADDGPGIPPEIQERIFEPYFTTKERGRGTGLGLATTHAIVTEAGGFLEVESRPGGGTTFRVHLPVHEAVATPPEEPPPGPEDGASGVRVLVLDDDVALLRVATLMLERFGCEVTAFDSPEEALERVEAAPHALDLVLTDQSMPSMVGTQVISRVRAVREDLPVVLCTGAPTSEVRAEAEAAGARRVLSKPVRLRDLSDLLRTLSMEVAAGP